MKSFSLNELKKELLLLPAKDLADLCVALAKYKKDNKDFLGYLLVDAYDKQGYITDVKKEMDEFFSGLQTDANLYYVKKSLRKELRIINKYIRYINDKATTVDLLIYFCTRLKNSGIPFRNSKLIVNLYEQQLKKAHVLVSSLHEDLKNDHLNELQSLKLV
jgi:hypothetical protein